MISAHINRQIFANMGMCPCCSMGEEHPLSVGAEPYFLIINPFQPKSFIKKWANNPQYCDPSFVTVRIQPDISTVWKFLQHRTGGPKKCTGPTNILLHKGNGILAPPTHTVCHMSLSVYLS